MAGLAWGDRCADCTRERRGRARRLARRIALVAALAAAILLGWGAPLTDASRIYIGIGTVGTFLLVRLIAMRLAMEYLPD